MDTNTKTLLKELYGFSEEILLRTDEIENDLAPEFQIWDDIKTYNQYKVLHAMQKNHLSDMHFNWTTGYGYNDIGREKTEQVFASVFGAEDAIVRGSIANGTHALTLCLQGVLKPGWEMISVTSKPYDTLEKVIGIQESYHSLLQNGVTYTQIDFCVDGGFDRQRIQSALQRGTHPKMVYVQRSKGYSRRDAISMANLKELITFVKGIDPAAVIMVDNCYGEFLDIIEPTEIGADLMAGSLIKNPGGGIALSGGYICGKKLWIDRIAQRLTAPGIGKDCGLTFGTSRTILQGLFLAPGVVSGAIKGALFCAKMFETMGYSVFPEIGSVRSDIIQSVGLHSEEEVIAFCKGIQKAAPVDSYVTPIPGEMPGYEVPVIMAAGAFVQGSSIELSADAPMREPYTVYFQGGLSYEHARIGVLSALQEIKKLQQNNI